MWIYNVSDINNYITACYLFVPCRFNNVEPKNVVRHLFPEVIVFVLSLISGVFLLLIRILEKKAMQMKSEETILEQPCRDSSISHSVKPEAATNALLISSEVPATLDTSFTYQQNSTELSLADVPNSVTEFENNIGETMQWRQQKLKLDFFPKLPIALLRSILWKSLFIVFLWFTGVCVASVLNYVHFICSIFLGLCWALHLNQIRIFVVTQRVIVVVVSLYSAVHLILLYLYQLQSAQELVPKSSLMARCVCIFVQPIVPVFVLHCSYEAIYLASSKCP